MGERGEGYQSGVARAERDLVRCAQTDVARAALPAAVVARGRLLAARAVSRASSVWRLPDLVASDRGVEVLLVNKWPFVVSVGEPIRRASTAFALGVNKDLCTGMGSVLVNLWRIWRPVIDAHDEGCVHRADGAVAPFLLAACLDEIALAAIGLGPFGGVEGVTVRFVNALSFDDDRATSAEAQVFFIRGGCPQPKLLGVSGLPSPPRSRFPWSIRLSMFLGRSATNQGYSPSSNHRSGRGRGQDLGMDSGTATALRPPVPAIS